MHQFSIDCNDSAILACVTSCTITLKVLRTSSITTTDNHTLINNAESQKLYSIDFSRPDKFKTFYTMVDTAVNFVYLMNGGRFVKILFEL